jgi:hypothetical protein
MKNRSNRSAHISGKRERKEVKEAGQLHMLKYAGVDGARFM